MKTPVVFRNREMLKLWAGQAISIVGDMITFLALPILVYQVTGSKAALSFTVFARALPILVFGSFAGALVDRWDRKKIMIASDLLRALLTIPLIFVGDEHIVATVMVVVALKSVIGIFFGPSMSATIPAMVRKEELMEVNSFMGITGNTLQFLAPLCGGALIGIYGPRPVLFIDLASFVVSAVAIYFTRIPWLDTGARRQVTVKSLARDIVDGFLFIRRSRVLVVVMVTTIITMFGQGFISPAWLPYVAEVLGQPMDKFALLVSLQGLGGIAGGLLTMAMGIRATRSTRGLYSVLAALVGVTIFMQTTTLNFSIFLVWGTLVGVVLAGWSATVQTILQHATDQDYMGRVNSTFGMVNQGAMILAVLISSLCADYLTARTLFVLACSLWLAGCLIGAVLMVLTGDGESARVEDRCGMRDA